LRERLGGFRRHFGRVVVKRDYVNLESEDLGSGMQVERERKLTDFEQRKFQDSS